MTETIISHIVDSQHDAIEELREIVRLPSIAATGDHLYETAKLVDDMLRQSGLRTHIHETAGAPVVTGELDVGASRTLLFYDHYDVQPPDPIDHWDSAPFELTTREGRLFGRGVADNKGDLISRIRVMRAYKELGKRPPVNVRFIVEGEEEISSPHLPEFVEKNREFLKADGGIWEFGGAGINGKQEAWLGLKGIVYVQLEVKKLSHDAHSSLACVLPSAAYRLAWALSSLKDEKEQILVDGFYDDIQPLSAAELKAIDNIDFNEDMVKRFYGIDSFVLRLTGRKLKEAYYNFPTCNICGVYGGYEGVGSKTVLPAEATAKLDFRLVVGMKPERILDKLRRHLDKLGFTDVKIAWHEGYPAAKTPMEHPFVDLVSRANTRAFGHRICIHPTSPGSGPLYLFAGLVPMVSVGCGNFSSRVHSPNENIEIEHFVKTMKRIVYLIDEMGRAGSVSV